MTADHKALCEKLARRFEQFNGFVDERRFAAWEMNSAKEMIESQAKQIAELEADRTEKRLETEIRKPADAKAYEQVTLAKAEREERIAHFIANFERPRTDSWPQISVQHGRCALR